MVDAEAIGGDHRHAQRDAVGLFHGDKIAVITGQLIGVPGVRACAVLRLADRAVLAQQGDADWLAAGTAETGRVTRGWRQEQAQDPKVQDPKVQDPNAPDALSWTHGQRQHLLLRLPDDGRDLALLAIGEPDATDLAELRWMATVARNAFA